MPGKGPGPGRVIPGPRSPTNRQGVAANHRLHLTHSRTQFLSPAPSPESLLSGSLSVVSHPESPLCSGNLSCVLKLVLASHSGLAFPYKACLSGLAVHVQVRRHSRPCPSGSLCPYASPKALCHTFAGQWTACPGVPLPHAHLTICQGQVLRLHLPLASPLCSALPWAAPCMVSQNSMLHSVGKQSLG